MDRRRILLVAAVVVAALGVALVFLYVRTADQRAEDRFQTSDVLVATQQIEAGETVEDALAANKLALEPVTNNQRLPGAVDNAETLTDLVALTRIYPGEQAITDKFGGATEVEDAGSLPIPEGKLAISVALDDPGRVAGFVNPGAEVAIFAQGILDFVIADIEGNTAPGAENLPEVDFSTVVLPKVQVLGVGSTTQVTTTTTAEDGSQTVEQLPRTLMTIAVDQAEAQRVLLFGNKSDLAFGLLTEDSPEINVGESFTFADVFGEAPGQGQN